MYRYLLIFIKIVKNILKIKESDMNFLIYFMFFYFWRLLVITNNFYISYFCQY